MEYNLNIIDIGTNYGLDIKNYSKKSNIYCFEPNPALYTHLKNTFSDYKNLNVYNFAVADYTGEADFYLTKDTYSSSLLNVNEKYRFKDVLKQTDKIKTKVINLKEFIEQNKIKQVDFYKSDAQGMDFKILKSIGDLIKIIKVGRIEVVNKNNQIYKDQDNYLEDIVEYLKSYEFECINEYEIKELFNNENIIDYDLKFIQRGKNIL